MVKTWIFTPAFARWTLVEDQLKFLYKDGPLDAEHVLIDQRYPIDGERNHAELKRLAKEYGLTYVDSGEDLGLHRGFNRAYRIVGVKPGDVCLGVDPDDRPAPGFVSALRDVMLADPSLAILGLSFWVIPWKREQGVQFTDEVIAGHNVWIHPAVEMINVVAWNTRFLEDIGGIDQPNAFYGGLEAKLYPLWAQRGLRLGYMPDVRSDHVAVDRNDGRLFDPEYRQWKDAHVAGFTGSFEAWLKIHAPGLL
jgi:hypothetical protein